ncbi:MAG TPA: tetraacyldisaccharide 4'-kinase [Edaphobacter sp.]
MSVRRPVLLPLAPLYGVGLAVKKMMFRHGWLKQNRLPSPVISVGSISAGGAGKTPMVLLLADILRRRGYAVRILTRGYKRTSELIERVEPYDDPGFHGDEPVLLAQRSGVAVFAGADRYRAGLLAEQDEDHGKIAVHLLDDGFQHRQLARDVDIVLLTQEDVEDHLLPAGNLREPLSTVCEADILVLREEEVFALQPMVSRLTGNATPPAIWIIRRRLSLGEAGEVSLPVLPLAFCGIARPESFTSMLQAESCMPVDTAAFPDHHAYTDGDIAHLLERARHRGANGFITTEKDAVKLTPLMREHLAAVGPLIVTRLSVELLDEKEAMQQLLSMVHRLDRRKR